MVHNKMTPAVNQIEVNPFQQQIDTQKFLQDNSVQVEAWAPFAEGEKHWHGATPSTAMTHIAVQEYLDSKAVDWLEHVSDEQYQAV